MGQSVATGLGCSKGRGLVAEGIGRFDKLFTDADGWALACVSSGSAMEWFALRPRRFGRFDRGHDEVPLGRCAWRRACLRFKAAVEADAGYGRWCLSRAGRRPHVDVSSLCKRVEVLGRWGRGGGGVRA